MLTTLFFCSPAFTLEATARTKSTTKTMPNTFANPDFAFPKDVKANAQSALRDALASGNSLDALRAAVQISVADNLVSRDSIAVSTALLANLSDQLPAPYSQLASLLEAQFYAGLYSSDRWNIDRRVLPADSLGDNPMLWGVDNFKNKINALTARAFRTLPQSDRCRSLTDFEGLITDTKLADRQGYLLYDFIGYKCLELNGIFGSSSSSGAVIPFRDSVSGHADPDPTTLSDKSVIASLIAFHKQEDPESTAMGLAICRQASLLPEAEQPAYLAGELGRDRLYPAAITVANKYFNQVLSRYLSGTPSINITEKEIAALRNGGTDEIPISAPDFLKLLSKIRKVSKDSDQLPVLDNLSAYMESKAYTFRLPELIYPGAPVSAEIVARNINDGWILFFPLPSGTPRNKSLKQLLPSLKLAASTRVPLSEDSIPFVALKKQDLPGFSAGKYVVAFSSSPNTSGIYTSALNSSPEIINVSEIDIITSASDDSDKDNCLYVVDARNQKPIRGVKVAFYDKNPDRYSPRTTSVTDNEGRVALTSGCSYAEASYNGSVLRKSYWVSRYGSRLDKNIRGNIFTNLAIYRPGQKVEFSAVVYSRDDDRISVAKDAPLSVILFDANSQRVDSLSLKSDSFGRISGAFTLPSDGLRGNWSLSLFDSHRTVTRRFFEVADYSLPTFFVTVDSIPVSPSAKNVRISGHVTTYSGMPVADAKVNFDIQYQPLWFWRSSAEPASYGGETRSSADGSFEISLPVAALKNTSYWFGRYMLNLSATSPAGETRQAPARMFAFSEGYGISSEIPEKVNADGSVVNLKVKVTDMLDFPVVKTLDYTLEDISTGKAVASGSFESPLLSIKSSSLPSGHYRLKVKIAGADSSEASDNKNGFALSETTDDFVVWRKDDKHPPLKSSVWTPLDEIVAPRDARNVKIKVGASYSDNYILMTVTDKEKVLERRWLAPKGKMIEVEVPAPADNNRVFVTFAGLRDFDFSTQEVLVEPYEASVRLSTETVTFRDRINPGARESWKFRFTLDGTPAGFLPAMAVMSNKALDALVPFRWGFAPSVGFSDPLNLSAVYPSVVNGYGRTPFTTKSAPLCSPAWEMYGYSPWSNHIVRYAKSRSLAAGMTISSNEALDEVYVMEKAQVYNSAEPGMKMELAEGVAGSADAAAEKDAAAEGNPASEEIAFRSSDVPLAFFLPSLSSDSEGYLSIDFDVPDFNSTWKLQLLGYTPDLKTSISVLEAVSSKKVMVQSTLPQFLRTSDKVVLAATLFNNSDETLPVEGGIIVSDPVTGEVLLSQNFNAETLAPSASRVVTVQLPVPTDRSALVVKTFAKSGGSSDGEQTLLPVLPSSQPVVDSTPFYLAPGESEFSLRLPKFKGDANITLQYCDNPVWYCLTALPDISVPESESVWSLSNALYANSIASGLIERYPSLKRGLLLALSAAPGDSTLVSNLQKNADLKIVALNNTSWVNDAADETLRMSRLSTLLDREGALKAVSDLWERMENLRVAGRGWSWCPGMTPSFFMTTKVLTNLGMLRSLGYEPEVKNLDKAVNEAVRWCDSEIVKEYKKYPKSFSPLSHLNYLYTRSFFSTPVSADFKPLRARIISAVKKDWRTLGVYEKATAAILLYREGERSVATTILKSLSQYSTYQKEKGRWFDNLSSSWNSWPRLITTTQVLEAFAEIDPSAADLDQIRQWLVVQRQTQNWGANSNTAEVVAAILSSGSDWTSSENSTGVSSEVTLNGQPLPHTELERLTGAFTVSLTPQEASGATLSVDKKSAGPAWGGVISQYVAPMKEVKAESVPDLKIEKRFYLVSTDGEGTSAKAVKSFKKGDRIRVTMHITCGRDMDYVALCDERPACFIPASQISEYTSVDGLWAYREVRVSSTNLFFSYMPKGEHVVSYDCFAQQDGTFAAGVASLQCQYAPLMSARSAGAVISVTE